MLKRLLALVALSVCPLVYAQGVTQHPINCSPGVPCADDGPASTGTGDNAPTMASKINEDIGAIVNALGNQNSATATLTNKTINNLTSVSASGDTTGATDAAAIAAVLTAGKTVALSANAHYYVNAGLTVDISKQALACNGAELDFGTLSTSGTAITLTATVGGANHDAQHERFPISNCYAVCPGGTSVGLLTSASAEPAVAFISLYNDIWENCGTGTQIGNNTYDLDFINNVWNLNSTSFLIPNSLSNSFERIHFIGGAMTNNSILALDDENGNGNAMIEGMSFDFNGSDIKVAHGARVRAYNSHFEKSMGYTTQWFQCEAGGAGGSGIILDGADILADGSSGTGAWPAIFDIVGACVVQLSGTTLMNNLLNTGNALVSGSGNLIIQNPAVSFGGSNPSLTAANIINQNQGLGVGTFATMTALTGVVAGATYHVTDVGVNGSEWRYTGSAWAPVNGYITLARAAGNVASPAATLTGVTSGLLGSAIAIPAGVLQTGSHIRVTALLTRSGSGGSVAFLCNLGTNGTTADGSFINFTASTTQLSYYMQGEVGVGSATTFVNTGSLGPNNVATSARVSTTTNFNTASINYVAFAVGTGNVADTYNLINYVVELWP